MTPHEHRNRTPTSEIDKEFLDIGICDKPEEVKAALPKLTLGN